jgi:hypothetical protein
VLFNFRKRIDEEVESGKGQLCQRLKTTTEYHNWTACTQEKTVFAAIVGDEKETFSNIPPPESDTVDGAGVSVTDVSSVLTVYDYEEKSDTIENSQSCSGSRTGRKPKGRGKTKDNILLTATKDISKILSESVALQWEERRSNQFGNKAFLLSFLPLMDSLPSDLSIGAGLHEASREARQVKSNLLQVKLSKYRSK